jgi:hypothetical protein
MKTRLIITVLLIVLLVACGRHKAPANQANWDNGTWNTTTWQ